VNKFHNTAINNNSFLITGGAGFIGSHIVEYLLNHRAKKVRVIDNLATGFKYNIDPFVKYPAYEFVEGDITDIEICNRVCKGIDYVNHQAALGSVPRSIENPLATHNSNANGFLNMIIAARDAGVKKFIFASSSSVYGDASQLPKKEENTGNPLSPYAVTKVIDEMYGRVFYHTYDFKTIGLRYFNIFGPRQNPSGPYAAVIPLMFQAMMDNKSPVIHGDGDQTRDFTFVENAVQANIKAMFCEDEKALGEIFNVAVGERVSVNDLFKLIAEITGFKDKPVHREPRSGDVLHSLADISKAKNILDYYPQIKIKEGLERTFGWFKESFTLR
jgi:UDP-N-acetylglucosamine/UDP-N-acetylgalactosamine 4-epimerase